MSRHTTGGGRGMANHRRGRLLLAIAGVVLIASAVAILASIHGYTSSSEARARALMSNAAAPNELPRGAPTSAGAPPPANGASAVACQPAATGAPMPGTAGMIIRVPSIGLVAPVEAGMSDPVLDEAVGHLDASNWPSQGGTDVLEAHNVTFFARIDRIPVGGEITLAGTCRTWTYTVTSKQVVAAGSSVANHASPTLILATCWPLNALFSTPDRYLVTAELTAMHTLPSPTAVSASPLPDAPGATIPTDMTAVRPRPDNVGVRIGRLEFGPGLSTRAQQSAQALRAANDAIDTFDAAVVSVRQHSQPWWQIVAPHVAMPDAVEAQLVAKPWHDQVDVTLTGTGDSITGATLTTDVAMGNRPPRGLTVTETVADGDFIVAGWRQN